MNFRRAPGPIEMSESLCAERVRLEQAWAEARSAFGADGPYLFGTFSAADAMFAPMVKRLEAYGLPVSPKTRAYMDAIEALPSWKEWALAAQSEEWVIPQFEV